MNKDAFAQLSKKERDAFLAEEKRLREQRKWAVKKELEDRAKEREFSLKRARETQRDAFVGQAKIQEPVSRMEAKTNRMKARADMMSSAALTYQTFKKPLWIILILLLVLGPGVKILMNMFAAMNIWMWIGLTFLIVLIWRNQ